MADFVATIKVNIESATGGSGGGGATGGGGNPPGGGGVIDLSPFVKTIQELRKEFSALSAQVRSITQSLEQIRTAQGATGGTGAPSRVSGPSAEAPNITKPLEESKAAAQEATKALNEQAAAQEKATQATREQADREEELADMHARATREAKEHKAAVDAATEAERRRAKALRELEGAGTPERQFGGKLNPIRQFEQIALEAARNPDVRKQAAKSIDEILDAIKIPESATEEVVKSGERLRKRIETIVTELFGRIEIGRATRRDIGRARGAIRSEVEFTREQVGTGGPTVDIDAIALAVAAKSLTTAVDRGEAAVDQWAKAVEQGVDAQEIANKKAKALADVTSANAAVVSSSRTVFGTNRRTGFENVAGGAAIQARLKEERLVGATRVPLEGASKAAFEGLRKSLSDLENPVKAVRQVIDRLVDSGDGLTDLRRNVQAFLDASKRLEQSDLLDKEGFPSREQFLNLQEIKKLLGTIKVGEGGTLQGRAGTVSREAGVLAGRQAVEQLRQRVAQRAASAGPGQQVRGISDDLTLQLPTDSGGVRKVRVDVQALGKTLDSVKVKAKDLSDNMFDRTSVRAALQRVAVWSAAAGVVFGAVSAFRQGLSTLIETESALVGLAKVTNESAVNLEAFKDRASAAATGIAKEFGQPLEDVLETMILFGQQGKTLSETISLSRASALAASVTTLNQPEAASALTAATQQFGLEFSKAEAIVDKFNEVANNAAVTETDLAQALKKSGQAAKNAGLDLDEFNGVVAAIAEQTRQSGNEIGTALRFIFSRLQTPEAEKGLAQVGVSARDASGNIRAFAPIIEDLAGKFDTLSNSQKTQVAISIAGTRRFNTLLALLDNFSRFQDSAADSANSAGSALREQEKVTETAAFKIEQLKNSLKELALSFGDSLLDPLKLVVDSLSTLVGIISAIPGPIKTMAAGVAIGSISFLKFTDHITDFLGLAGSVRDAGSVIGGSLRRNLTQGLSTEAQISRFGEEQVLTSSAAVFAARGAPDFSAAFGKNRQAISAFSRELSKSNLQLVTQRGQVLKSSAAFGKFGATIRGFGVTSDRGLTTSALALAGLNSGISRFGAFLGIIANKITSVIPGIAALFRRLDVETAKANSRLGSVVGTLGRFAVAGLAIGLVVKGLGALRDAAFESAEEVERGLEPEIQKRKEALNIIEKQRQQVKSLTEERRRAASVQSPSPTDALTPSQEQDVLSGGFRSSVVAIRNIRRQEQEAANAIGFANPALIDSIDEFGNVVLSSATAFDALAESAGNAQKVLLGLSQVEVIGGFNDELKTSSSLLKDITKGLDFALSGIGLGSLIPDEAFTSVKERFDESLAEFKEVLNDPIVREARRLGVDVGQLSPGKAEQLRDAGAKFQTDTVDIQSVLETSRQRIRDIVPDSGELVFRKLAAEGRQFFEAERQILGTQGIEVSIADLLNQAQLQNKSALKNIRDDIAASPALTIGQLRERGRPLQFTDLVDANGIRKGTAEIREELRNFSGGELIILEDIDGNLQQGFVRVTATGKRLVEFAADEFGNTFTQELGAAIESGINTIQWIDPDVIQRQLTVAMQELGRVVSGAGRGGILGRDLELGAAFSFDLSGQQRAAQADELLFADLQLAQENLAQFRASFGAEEEAGKEGASKLTDPENVARVAELATAVDKLATAARIKVEIEEVAIAFEKAANTIKNTRIKEAVEAQFSGVLGAASGAIKRAFETPVLPGQVDRVSTSDAQSNDIVELGNTLSRVQQANGELVSGLLVAQRNIGTFIRDFENAGIAGGLRDPNRVSDLARRSAALSGAGLDKAQSILVSLNDKQLTQQEKTNELLAHIAGNFSDQPRLIGAAFAASARSAQGDPEGLRAVAAAIEKQGDKISGFTPEDFQTILTNIPANLIPTVVQEFRRSQAGGAAANLTSELLRFGGRDSRLAAETLRVDPTTVATIALNPEFSNEATFEDALKKFQAQTELQQNAQLAASRQALGNTQNALRDALSSAISDSDFARIVSDPNRLGEVQVEEGALLGVLTKATQSLLESSNKATREIGATIAKEISAGGDDRDRLLQLVENAVLRTVDVGTPSAAPSLQEEFQLTDTEAQRLNEAIRATVEANDRLLQSTREVVGAFFNLKDSVITAGEGLEQAARQALDEITIGRQTEQFTTAQVGLLAGVSLPNTQLDARRNIADLSGAELTALESPNLSRGLNEVNSAFGALVGQLAKIKQEQLDTQRTLEAFRAEGNVRGINLAREALTQLGGIATLVEGQIGSAQGTLQDFGESFRNIEAVNQLRVDVEKLVQAFDKEIELKFDRTSIQTALGNTLFSATRPTFEQFEQGQSGFLTKFERTLATIDFQESARQITPQQATRQRARAEFERDEDLIALAQGRENEKLQAAVSTAEQIRSRLLDFVATGAPGNEVAQSLLNQITSELEQAGDIIPGQGGTATVRDPRTGRSVDVPASQVNTFRGLPGLGRITEQLTALSQEATRQEARTNAELITKPLLVTLDKIPTKLDEIANALKEAGDLEGAREVADVVEGSTDVQSALQKILAPLQKDSGINSSDVARIIQGLSGLADIKPDTLAGLLSITQVAPGGRGTEQSLETFLRETLPNVRTEAGGRTGAVQSQNIQEQINRVFERASEGISGVTTIISDSASGFADSTSELSTTMGDLNTKLAGESGFAGGLDKAVQALGFFTKALGGDFVAFMGTIQSKIGNFFGGGGVQRRAQGGLITGPGGPTEDRVPVLASPGEFVINARAARAIGLDSLNALNGTTSTRGADALAAGASLGFQEGGLVDVEKLQREQKARLAAARQRALEEEASRLGVRKLRAKLEELQGSRRVYELGGAKPDSDLMVSNQKEIDKVTKQLAFARKKAEEDKDKREKEAAQLEELRAKGIARNRDGLVSVPDSALGPSKEQQIADERSRQSKLAEREGTFQPIAAGRSFARLAPEGDRIIYEGTSENGGVDVNSLLGVSTTDLEEFDREVKRRAAQKKALSTFEEDREKQKVELIKNFNAAEQAKESLPQGGEEAAFGQAYAGLQELLRRRNAKYGTKVQDVFEDAARTLDSANKLFSGERDGGIQDFKYLQDELTDDFVNVKGVIDGLKAAKHRKLPIARPPGFVPAPDETLPVRSEASGDAGIRVLENGFEPFISPFEGGLIFSDDGSIQPLIASFVGAQLPKAIDAAIDGAQDASRSSGAGLVKIAGGKAIRDANAFIADANAAIQQSIDNSDLLADTFVGDTLKKGTETAAGVAQLGTTVAIGLPTLVGSAQQSAFTRGEALDTLVSFIPGVESARASARIDELNERKAELEKKLRNTTDEADRAQIKREINNLSFRATSEKVNVAAELLPGVGKINKLAKGTRAFRAVSSRLPTTRATKAKRFASNIYSIDEARDALKKVEIAEQQSVTRSATKEARANKGPLRERIDFLEQQEKLEAGRRARALEKRAEIDARARGDIEFQVADALESRSTLGIVASDAFGAARRGLGRARDLTRRGPSVGEAVSSVRRAASDTLGRRRRPSPRRQPELELDLDRDISQPFPEAPERRLTRAERAEERRLDALRQQRRIDRGEIVPQQEGRLSRFFTAGSGLAGALGGGALGNFLLGAASLKTFGGIAQAAGFGFGGLGLGIGAATQLSKFFRRAPRVGRVSRGPTLADRIVGAFSGRRGRGQATAATSAERGFATGLADGPTVADGVGVSSERGFATGLSRNQPDDVFGDIGITQPTDSGLFDIPDTTGVTTPLDELRAQTSASLTLGPPVEAIRVSPRASQKFLQEQAELFGNRTPVGTPRLSDRAVPRADLDQILDDLRPDAFDQFIDEARTDARLAQLAEESPVPRPIEPSKGLSRTELEQLALERSDFTFDARGRTRVPKGGLDILTDSGRVSRKGGAIKRAEALRSEQLRAANEFGGGVVEDIITDGPSINRVAPQAIPSTIIDGPSIQRDIARTVVPDTPVIARTLVPDAPILPDSKGTAVLGARGKGKVVGPPPPERFSLAKFQRDLEARQPGLDTPIRDPRDFGPSPIYNPLDDPFSVESIRRNLAKADPNAENFAQRQARLAREAAEEANRATAIINVPRRQSPLDRLLSAFGRKSGINEGLFGSLGAGISLLPDVGRFIRDSASGIFGRRRGAAPDIGAELLAEVNQGALSPLERSRIFSQEPKLPFGERARRLRQQQLDEQINERVARDVDNPIAQDPQNITAVLEREEAAARSVLQQSRQQDILSQLAEDNPFQSAARTTGEEATGAGARPRRIDDETPRFSAAQAPESVLLQPRQSLLGRFLSRRRERASARAEQRAFEANAQARLDEANQFEANRLRVLEEQRTKVRPEDRGALNTPEQQLALDTFDDLRALEIQAASLTQPENIVRAGAELGRGRLVARLQSVRGGGFEDLAPLSKEVESLVPTFLSRRYLGEGRNPGSIIKGIQSGQGDRGILSRIELFSDDLILGSRGRRVQLAEDAQQTFLHEAEHFLRSDRADSGGAVSTAEGADIVVPALRGNPLAQRRQSFLPNERITAKGVREVKDALSYGEDAQFLGSDESLIRAVASRREFEKVRPGLEAGLLTKENRLNINIDTHRRFQQFIEEGTGLTDVEAKAILETKIEPAAYSRALLEARGTTQRLFQNTAFERYGVSPESGYTRSILGGRFFGNRRTATPDITFNQPLAPDTRPLPPRLPLPVPQGRQVLTAEERLQLSRFALGGKISGPGGPTSDRIPILASAGEFVLNANAVSRLGLPVVESMNRTGNLPRFQHGGSIDDDELASAQSELRGGPRLLTRNEVFGGTRGIPAAFLGGIAQSGTRRLVDADPDVITARRDYEQAKERLTDAQALAEQRATNVAIEQQAASSLVTQREANARFSEQAQQGLITQREANARFSAQANAALLEAQGRNSFNVAPGTVVPDNREDRGTAARLQASVDELDLEGFGGGGFIRDNMLRFRGGGSISGPGGPRSDSILARLSDGEFVINAASADKLGLPILEELNNTGRLPGFQDGGDVSGRTSGGLVATVNTEEIAAAIKDALITAATEATITIDTGAAAENIGAAVEAALKRIELPAVKIDESSVRNLNLGDSVGAAVIGRLDKAEGSIKVLQELPADISYLKTTLERQEEVILDKVDFKLNKENDTRENTNNTNPALDKEISIIKSEMIRLERTLIATTDKANQAFSEALKK
jgi:TP901 family phage tail tape measure protein